MQSPRIDSRNRPKDNPFVNPNPRMPGSIWMHWVILSLVVVALARDVAAQGDSNVDTSKLSGFLSTFYTDAGGGGPTKTTWVQSIDVSTPAYCSAIKGDTPVRFKAPGMTVVHALCWQQPAPSDQSRWGQDVELAPNLKLNPDSSCSFIFHADKFPNGPINLRLYAKDNGNNQDYCELQLFNQGGVSWNQGIPKGDPPAAQGLQLVFSDDFSGPLSIAGDKSGKYWTHWGGGDGSVWAFGEYEGPHNPFSQVKGQTKNYLRIHASKPEGTRGVTGSLTPTNFGAKAPCYMECRFLAQNATGTWPGFWACAKKPAGAGAPKERCDEIDIIEAYGTNTKSGGIWTGYHVTTHFWGQEDPAWAKDKAKGPDGNPYAAHKMVAPMLLGGKSSWSTTFHTYGALVTPTFTTYYLDDVEVLRHPSGEVSATEPFCFLVNLAVGGGGWQPDLQRYANQSDMWIDYIRVYQAKKP